MSKSSVLCQGSLRRIAPVAVAFAGYSVGKHLYDDFTWISMADFNFNRSEMDIEKKYITNFISSNFHKESNWKQALLDMCRERNNIYTSSKL